MKPIFLLALFCSISSSIALAQKVEKAEIPQGSTQTVPQPVEQVYVIVEQMPEFPGGQDEMMKFLAKTIKYPPQALKDDVEGKVYVSFIIAKTGIVRDVQVVKGIRQDLNDEAIRVISLMPAWRPGKQRARAVNVKYILPITFHHR